MSSLFQKLSKIGHKICHSASTAASFSMFGVWGTWLAWVELPRIYRRTPGDDEAKSLACRERVSASFRYLFHFMHKRHLFDLEVIPKREDLPADGRFVLIANHPSLIDMVALFACFPQVVIVAANYMYRTPALGPLLRRCKFIDGGDGSVFSGASVVSAGVQRIACGTPVLIFPEGTRSPISGFGKFRVGAFEMAKQAGVPIIPAYLSTVPRTLMKGMPWYRIPAEVVKVRITLGEPIRCGEGEAARDMMKRVQDHYESKLREIGMIREGAAAAAPALPEKPLETPVVDAGPASAEATSAAPAGFTGQAASPSAQGDAPADSGKSPE